MPIENDEHIKDGYKKHHHSGDDAFTQTNWLNMFFPQEFYPVNYLRNIALEHVRTPFVFLNDIDFVPVPGAYNSLR